MTGRRADDADAGRHAVGHAQPPRSRPSACPLRCRYRFAVAPDAPPLSGRYGVFVHFLDADGELMWTDDHQPPTPTRQWKPGQPIEYSAHDVRAASFPTSGDATIVVGLYSPGVGRAAAAGRRARGRAVPGGDVRDWRRRPTASSWSSGTAGTRRRRPDDGRASSGSGRRKAGHADVPRTRSATSMLYPRARSAAPALPAPQQVEIRVGERSSTASARAGYDASCRSHSGQRRQWATAETVELTVVVDKTFVPASSRALKSSDSRELGIRVFRAFVQPL